MDNYWMAWKLLNEYIHSMNIECFAFPELTSAGVKVVLIDAKQFSKAIENCLNNGNLPAMLTIEKGELFFRMKKQYSAVKMWQGLQGIGKVRFDTNIKRINDIPTHKGMKARGWEKVVADAIGGLHTGDDIKQVDVISDDYGRIECKIGGGRIYTASKDK